MDITRAQQKALDDDLVALANRLKIGKCNLRLSSNLNSKEPTLQVVLDPLKLTSFYKAFEIIADIFPKLLGQKFEDPPFEEEILSFIRDLGHTSEIKHLTNQSMLESEAYKTYHEYATSEKIPKPKYVKNKADPESSPKKKSAQASKGKRIKTSTKVAKPVKKKQQHKVGHQKKLDTDSQLSRQWFSDEDDDDEVNESEDADDQNNVNADNEGDYDQDDDNEQTKSDNDDDDLVHPKLSNFNEKERQDEEDKEEEWSDDEAYDDETQGVNVEGEELDEEETNEEDKSK
ncbi:hypothetical protein Tco_0363086 [Tanacetum coccineum]